MQPSEQPNPNLWQPDDDDQQSVDEPLQNDVAPINEAPIIWRAHEYVHLEKNFWWFLAFVAIVLGLIALDIFLMHTYTFSALVIVMAIAVMVYIRRPPRELNYSLSNSQGLYVGDRLYHFDEFKAFGLIQDGDQNSIFLIPTKRFALGVSVFFPDEVGEQIVDTLNNHLPMENLKLDAVDLLIRKLRL